MKTIYLDNEQLCGDTVHMWWVETVEINIDDLNLPIVKGKEFRLFIICQGDIEYGKRKYAQYHK